MKRYRLWNGFSHASVVLSAVFIVLFVIDRINPAMGFIGSDQGDWLLLLFCLVAMTNGVITAVHLLRREKHRLQREEEEMRRERRGGDGVN